MVNPMATEVMLPILRANMTKGIYSLSQIYFFVLFNNWHVYVLNSTAYLDIVYTAMTISDPVERIGMIEVHGVIKDGGRPSLRYS